jgi:hypothetical protein
VDRYARLIMLLLVLAVSLLRLIRHGKAATAKRPSPAIPPSAGVIVQPPVSAATAAPTPAWSCVSPIEPEGTSGARFAGGLATAVVWIAGNVAIWSLLFGLPALDAVPQLVRLVAGVLANFYLLYLARALRARLRSGVPQTARREGDTPFV